MRSILCVFLAGILASCNLNNVNTNTSFKKYFDEHGTDGSFAIFDNGRGEFTIYNLTRDTSRFLPASTFKIMNALVALEEGVVNDENGIIPWDGVERENASWNKDLTLQEAFKVSAVPHFQWIARELTKDTLQKWIDSVKYGNGNLGNTTDSFWLDNSLLISPDEQIGLVKKLYFDQLPFRKSVQKMVRDIMVVEDNSNYTLCYKTGWGINPGNKSIGWVVGWIEENRHPYFFALNIEADRDKDMVAVRKDILDKILKEIGFFEGKM